MRNSLPKKLAIALLGLVASIGVQATVVLSVDAGWTADPLNNRVDSGGFSVESGDGTDATDDFGGWDFTLGATGQLSITDAIDRDSYKIDVWDYNSSSLIFSGLTTELLGVPLWTGGGTLGALFNDAWADATYHGLQLLLDPGSYNVKIWLEELDFDSPGDGFDKITVAGIGLRVDTEHIPEPHTLILLGTGLVVLARRRRGRRSD